MATEQDEKDVMVGKVFGGAAVRVVSELRELRAKLEADASALWAVRVLDAWADKQPRGQFPPVPQQHAGGVGFYVWHDGKIISSHTREAVRIEWATALVAVDPSLDPDAVRGK